MGKQFIKLFHYHRDERNKMKYKFVFYLQLSVEEVEGDPIL
jgi:hypothetical protein